ncbi:MAG: GGDEF domain-containing protein [Spirochaetes bacterium]|nr:GGDEF domain-containing protein [Spirochaetota bacterium]
MANRITSTLRETDLAGRIGGDEFVACAGGLADTADSMAIAEKLIQNLQQPIAFSSGSPQISASIGIALYPEHGQAEPELMQAADKAMYRSKRGGRGQICLAE